MTSLYDHLEPAASTTSIHLDKAELLAYSQALSLKRLADTLDKVEKHLAPIVTTSDTATPDPLERIAEALDSLAALHAAGPALKATGLDPVNHASLIAELNRKADGWVEWNGSEQAPVGPDIVVELLIDSGRREWGAAKAFDWSRVNFYKIVNQ